MIAAIRRPGPCAALLALCLILTPSKALAGAPFSVDSEELVVTADSQLRFWEGTFDVPGQSPVHFTCYAPADAGSYDAILFLHGYGKDDYIWTIHQMVMAGRGVIAVAIDYEETQPQEAQLAEVSSAVDLMHSWQEVNSVSLCGSSYGGKVALEAVAKRPELGIETALLVYPAWARLEHEDFAAIEADVVNVVGEVDGLSMSSYWIQDQIHTYNDRINYKLYVYSEDDFPIEARHGYFFARTPQEFGDVALDSFARGIGYFDWMVGGDDAPMWRNDPTMLTRDDLITLPGF